MRTFIQTPTGNLEESLEFYKKLNYRVLSEENPLVVTDGKAFIQINPDRYARAGLRLLNPEWKITAKKLEQLTDVMETEDGYLVADSSGIRIYLVETEDEPAGTVSETSDSVLGNYVGISLETPGINKSAEIFRILGFSRDNSDWPSFTNSDGITVTFYQPNSCPHLFFNPSLTYFNGKQNEEVIRRVRKQNIPITEEITLFNEEGIVDNIVLKDPAGLGFLIFSD